MGGRFCSQLGVLFHRHASPTEFRRLSPTRGSLPAGTMMSGARLSLRTASVLSGSVFSLTPASLLTGCFRTRCFPAQGDSDFLIKIMNCVTQLTEAGTFYVRRSRGSWVAVGQGGRRQAACSLLRGGWPLATMGSPGADRTVPALWGHL